MYVSKEFFEEFIMKKLLTLLLVFTMLFVFAACGNDVQTPENDVAEQTSYDGLDIALELTSEEYGIGFRKGSDLTDKVNALIDQLNADGTLDALAEKYQLTLSEAETPDAVEATVKDIDYITENGKMVIGITDYAPMNYKDDKGNWTGFDTEFAEAVCEKLGVKAEFVEIEWDNKFIALESKAIDCIWNGMTISEEVLKNTSCSKAYVKNAQVVVMAEDKIADYKDAEAMKELSFAVESGSAGATAAKDSGFEDVLEDADLS